MTYVATFPDAAQETRDEPAHLTLFYGTDLDLQLRRRNIARLVLGGISTSASVEATARNAYERNYKLLFVEDAMAALSVKEHDRAIKYVFPRMGIVRSTAEVLAAMG